MSTARQIEMLTEVRRVLADVVVSRTLVELQEEQLEMAAERLRGQAVEAVRLGRDDLARTALSRRAAARSQVEELRPQHDGLRSEEDELTVVARRLRAGADAVEPGDVRSAVRRAEDMATEVRSRVAALDELLASGALEDVSVVGGPRDDIQAALDETTVDIDAFPRPEGPHAREVAADRTGTAGIVEGGDHGAQTLA